MDPFISLSTRKTDLSIKIDGVTYAVPLPEQFRFRETIRFERARQRMSALKTDLQKDDLPPEGIEAAEREFQLLMDEVMNLILREVPEEIRKKLTDWERLALLGTYQRALGKIGFFQKQETEESPSPGTSGSAASAASTEAPESPGSTPQQ